MLGRLSVRVCSISSSSSRCTKRLLNHTTMMTRAGLVGQHELQGVEGFVGQVRYYNRMYPTTKKERFAKQKEKDRLAKKTRGLTKREREVRAMNFLIRAGDTVKVMAGPDMGKQGSVLEVNRKFGSITVEGVNMYFDDADSITIDDITNETTKKPYPIDYNLVKLVDPATKKECDVESAQLEMSNGKIENIRVNQDTGKQIPFPPSTSPDELDNKEVFPKDTLPNDVLLKTYVEPSYEELLEQVKGKLA